MGDWYKVNYKKIRGYVKKEQVEIIKQNNNNDKNGVNSNYTNEQSQNTNENTVNENTVTEEQTTQEEKQEENKNEQEKETLENIQVGEKLYTKSELQVYLRPLPTSMKMEKLVARTEVTVIDVTGNWVYVSANGKTGWIRKELLTKTKENNNNNNDNDNNSKKPEENNINKTGYITTDGINFRQKADTDSKVLKTFAANAKVTILKEEGKWYKVKHNDKEGYVLKTYVSEKKVAEVTSRSSVRREETSTTKVEEKKQEGTKAEATTKEASSKGSEVVAMAKKYLGSRYVYGGASPSGFDCSGFTMYIYKQFGVSLPHSATAQSSRGTKVEKANLQPGDIVFFTNYKTGKGIGHCGIYIGGGQFIHASTERTGVITTSLNSGSHARRYVTAVRIF